MLGYLYDTKDVFPITFNFLATMIELKDVSKRFKSKEKRSIGKYFLRNAMDNFLAMLGGKEKTQQIGVLNNINLRIDRGEHIGLIGKNKSGKTTLLQIICGITEPSSGTATIDGKIIPLFAQGGIFAPDLTGREYIYLHSTALGVSKKLVNDHIDQIIEFSEITVIDTPVKFYSTGMRTRLYLSVTLFMPADIFILDEIFSGSDIFFKEKVMNLLEVMMKTNKTFIFVSHNEDTIARFCKRSILLHKGQIAMDGATADVTHHYKMLEESPA